MSPHPASVAPFLALLLAVAVLALVARRISIPYPILFVIGGLLLSLVPHLPKVRLNPEFIFLFILPPLLYSAAFFTGVITGSSAHMGCFCQSKVGPIE